jgi:hypothetical protein
MSLGSLKIGILFCFLMTTTIFDFINCHSEQSFYLSEGFSNLISEMLIKEMDIKKIDELRFLENRDLLLNISDFSVNAALFMAQRSLNLDITAKNDSSNPLPMSIDTKNMNLLVDELRKYPENMNMTLRIYENSTLHPVPRVLSDPDGPLILLTLGMEYGVYESGQTEPTQVLSYSLPAKIKLQLEDTNNKLTIGLLWVEVADLIIYYDSLNVDRERLRVSMQNFISVAFSGVKSDLTSIDVLGKIANLTGYTYTNLDVLSNYGNNIIHISP